MRVWPALGDELFYLRERLRHSKEFATFQKKFWLDHYAPGDPVVLSGPFSGMRYLKNNFLGPALPRWLGTYEAELHGVICDRILQKKYDLILVVGSAEGFYACGFARHFPATPILSFETTLISRIQQKCLLKINNVRNVQINGKLNIKEFLRLIRNKKCLCLIDIEGAEIDFCSLTSIPFLGRADLLLEIHASGNRSPKQVLEKIKSELDRTHCTKILNPIRRNIAALKAHIASQWTIKELEQATKEHRGVNQQWLWAEAKIIRLKKQNHSKTYR